MSFAGVGPIPITNGNMLFTDNTYTTTTNGWKKIIFNFTTSNTAGENILYIGALNDVLSTPNNPSSQGVGSCAYGNYNFPSNAGTSYYFLDNVKMTPIENKSVYQLQFV